MRTQVDNINADFYCKHCSRLVSASSALSGVVHRNHCPYCLYSRHVDLFRAGDRLCACKSLMAPVGLTLKRSRDKYASQPGGELMLVHCCSHCGELIINRVAADDIPEELTRLIIDPVHQEALVDECAAQGINLLGPDELPLVQRRLFGQAVAKNRAWQAQF